MTPTSLFIPLISGSTWNDCEELRYALRSWEMYSNVNTVYICGYLPKWCVNIEHIPYTPQVKYNKPAEIMAKAKLCPADEFIFSNDDIYLLKPLKELPDYHAGLIRDFKGGSDRYMGYVKQTDLWGDEGLYFDVHTPMIMKRYRLRMMPILDNVLFKSYYVNSGPYLDMNTLPYRDLKINHHIRAEEIDNLIGNSPFVSTGERISNDMKAWLRNKFPNKSKWEV